MKTLLFVHCNYPAQFRHLARHYASLDNWQVHFLSSGQEWTAKPMDGVARHAYKLQREPRAELAHPYLRRMESCVLHGQAALQAALKLRQQGLEPDLIVGHSGFGNTLYLKEVWPKARFVGYFEWFYRTSGSDVGFGRDEPPSPDTSLRVHTYNAPILMDLAVSDGALCPTHWQASQFPAHLRERIKVVFDGIDTEQFKPLDDRSGGLQVRDVTIPADVPLVTYTTRGFEPYRGWPQVAEGLALLLQRNPHCHVLLVGSDDVAYGAARGDGKSWRQWALEQHPMDPSRLHHLPPLQYDEYLKVLQASWVHLYWTIPFILSWSLMESLSTGCSVVASATAPVQEMVSDGENGLLVDFHQPQQLAHAVDLLLNNRELAQRLSRQARRSILDGHYDRQNCLQEQITYLETILS